MMPRLPSESLCSSSPSSTQVTISMSRWGWVRKPVPACDDVVVADEQQAVVRVLGVVVVAEAEAVVRVEPVDAGVEPARRPGGRRSSDHS